MFWTKSGLKTLHKVKSPRVQDSKQIDLIYTVTYIISLLQRYQLKIVFNEIEVLSFEHFT